MDPPLRLGRGHTLHAVAARFELERGVDEIAFDADDKLLVAAEVARTLRQHLGAPAFALGVAQVHAREVAGEQRRLVAAGAGADLEEDVAHVVGVARQQRCLQLAEQAREVGAGRRCFVAREPGHRLVTCRFGEQLVGRREVALALLVAAKQLDQRARFRVLAAKLAVALHVGGNAAVGEQRVELAETKGETFELLAEGRFHGRWNSSVDGERRRAPHARARRERR